MRHHSHLSTAALLLIGVPQVAAAATPQGTVALRKILAPRHSQAGTGLSFATAIATEGDTLVVGEPTRTIGGRLYTGEVRIFIAPNGDWRKTHQKPAAVLRASDAKAATWPFVGNGVAIDKDVVVAGAAYNGGPGNFPQEAYVFVKPKAGWADATESARLQSPGSQYQLGNAGAVAIQGDTIVVGCLDTSYQGIGNAGCGAVYVKPPGGWQGDILPVAVLTDGGVGDSLGWDVAISGDTIALAAPEANETRGNQGGAGSGAVQIYEKPTGGWASSASPTATLIPSDPDQGTCGYRIALFRDTLVSGCPFALVQGQYDGAAYVYVRPGAHWVSATQTAKLDNPAAGADDGTPAVGIAVAIRDGMIAAGANGATPPDGAFYGGEIYVYRKHGGRWANTGNPDATAYAPNAEGALQLGISLSIDGNIVVGGAGAPDMNNLFQGAAYIFSLPPP